LPVNLNAVLTPLQRGIRQRTRGKARCRFSLLPELWTCRVDGGTVGPIVLDLVTAAVAVVGTDGNLIVGTRNFAFDTATIGDYPGARIGEFARITVRDSGPGLTDAEFEQILDPGLSARPALAKAAAAAERLGGFVRVESAEGVGTAVHLYFPRVAGSGVLREELPANPTAEVAE
jgi:signal transduction histidine kinase